MASDHCYVIKNKTKQTKNTGRNEFREERISLHNLPFVIKRSQAETHIETEAKHTEECCLLTCYPGLVNYVYTSQAQTQTNGSTTVAGVLLSQLTMSKMLIDFVRGP